MNVLSLFDGISCGKVALDRLGINATYYASEIDQHAINISTRNHPDIVRLGDVMSVHAHRLPHIDLLMGGSPCKDLSLIGSLSGLVCDSLDQYLAMKRGGCVFMGTSYLFWEYVRILAETKPTYFLLENVKMKPAMERIITKTLQVEPITINSDLVSAQNRVRYYWTNIPAVTQPNDLGIVLGDIVSELDYDPQLWLTSDELRRVHPLTNIRTLSQKSHTLTTRYSKLSKATTLIPVIDGSIRLLSLPEMERLQTLPNGYTEGETRTHRITAIANGWTADVIKHILSFI